MRFVHRYRSQATLIVSILLHGLVWVMLSLKLVLPLSLMIPPKSPMIEVTVIVPPAPPKPQIKHPKKEQMQIVEQEDTADKTPNEEAKYLSASNQKVEKQTQAKDAGEFVNQDKLNKDIATQDTSAVRAPASEKNKSVDHLKDIETGMKTMLDTKELASFGYYVKIRNQVRKYWEDLVRDRKDEINDTKRRMSYFQGDQKTKLAFIISQNGNLESINIVQSSGLDIADEIALEAFRQASPFPPPPQDLLDENREVQMQWDLVIEDTN
jgi:TonB family protein